MIRFEYLFSTLNKAKVRYLIVNGVEVNLYGIERATADVEGTIIPVVSMKHLIEMKEKTCRPQDIADVFYLRKIQEEWNNGN